MAEKLNDAARNQQADAIGTDLDSGTCGIYVGASPADPADDPAGTLLVEIELPADAFAAAASGSAAKQGTWSEEAVGAGDAGCFMLKNAGETKKYHGSVTATGGGGDMELDNITIAVGQIVTISSGSITQPAS